MQNEQPIQVTASPGDEPLLRALKEEIDRGVVALQQGNATQAIRYFEEALKRTPTRLAAYDILSHNTLTACKQEIERLLQEENLAPIQTLLQRAFELTLQGPMANDIGFRTRFADAYYDLGKAFYRSRIWEAALACVRHAISIQPCPSYYVDLTNALAFVKSPARLQDYHSALTPTDLGRHLFIACAPKSGSTFLKNLLIDLTRFKDVFSVYAGLQNEQELDLPQLSRFAAVNTVTQQHCRATEANLHLMQAFAIRPVVLVRDLFDTVISLRDFYDGGFVYSTFFDREEYIRLSDEERIDLLIEFAVPWYFQFFASWQRAEREGRLEVLWLGYEELIDGTPAVLERVLAFYGIAARGEDIRRIVETRTLDARSNRFNQGRKGRGQTHLTASQRQRIESLGRYFPGTDFSRFGLASRR